MAQISCWIAETAATYNTNIYEQEEEGMICEIQHFFVALLCKVQSAVLFESNEI